MLSDPLFICLAVLSVMLMGVSKSGFGGAMGGLAVPLLSLVISTPQAAAIMLPIMLLMDVLALWMFRGRGDVANLRIIVPGALLGILAGFLFFHAVDMRWIKGIIGLEALLFGLERFRHVNTPAGDALHPNSLPRRIPGLLWSALSGFTSFISHAGGPPILQYLLPQNMERIRLVATTVIFFAVVNFAKLVPYSLLGLFDSSNLLTSLCLLPAVPLGFWVGMKVLKGLAHAPFNYVIASSMVLTGAKLLVDALSV